MQPLNERRTAMNVLSVVEYQGFWGSFGDLIWWFLSIFVLFAYIMAVFAVITDIFRDHSLNGWFKAIWVVFLVFVPFLTVLVYLIARGRGMSERSAAQAKNIQAAQEAYIQQVAGVSPSEEIARAKQLYDDGTISAEEYERLKGLALSGAAQS